MSKVHTRSCTVPKGRVFTCVLPGGAGPVVAHEGETVLVIVAHSYEAAVGEALRRLNQVDDGDTR